MNQAFFLRKKRGKIYLYIDLKQPSSRISILRILDILSIVDNYLPHTGLVEFLLIFSILLETSMERALCHSHKLNEIIPAVNAIEGAERDNNRRELLRHEGTPRVWRKASVLSPT